ncbi:MAG: acyltransferase family protein [Bdellovibrionales bacterium]|nr:acyltransferase family protein [Bdellovibrionales bacterium]
MSNEAHHWFLSPEDDQKITEVFKQLRVRYQDYKDPWGFNLELCENALRKLMPLYRSYFKVRVFGQENIQDKPYLVVGNHTGQIPLDGMLVTIAFAFDVSPPRILRAMVERFLAQMPFLGDLTAQTGSILGDRANCEYLVDHGESILIFPEGVKGISKNTPDYYKLRPFSQGFYRIALQKKTPILPICVIGAEEMFPLVFHAKKLASMLKIPSLPISANFLPLPSPIDIYIGKEIPVPEHMNLESTDKEIKENVFHIENTIKKMIIHGLANRRPFFDSIRKPISKYLIQEFRNKKNEA